ncbi:MAG: class I SAM-dependent methyltransferase [Thermoflexales bacterium]
MLFVAMQCELCGAVNSQPALKGGDRLMGVPGVFALRRCLACGTFGQDPVPGDDTLLSFYPLDYGPYQSGGILSRLGAESGLRRRERHVDSLKLNAGSLLDVGCATGLFLDRMRRRGWRCVGVEFNPKIAQRARDDFGLAVVTGTLETAQFPDAAIDLVTLWDVLEHVQSPRRTLLEIARVMRPGGWLVIRVPDPESLGAQIFGRFWAGWDLPRHLWIAPRTALERALGEAGFCLKRTSASSGRFSIFAASVRYTARDRIKSVWIANAIAFVANSLIARVLTAPYFSASGAMGHGSMLTYFAQRQ